MMKLLEYQGKELLRQYNIEVPRGYFCTSAAEVAEACDKLGGQAILKIQIPSGRRGLGGGIQKVQNAIEGFAVAERMLKQSYYDFKPAGLLVEEILTVEKELYFSILTDTSTPWFEPLILFSEAGGMEVEEVLHNRPEDLRQEHVDPRYGLGTFQLRRMLAELGLNAEVKAALSQILSKAWEIYWKCDLELLEINPLAITTSGKLVALDAKMSVDSNAHFRQQSFQEVVFENRERQAKEVGLSYVELEGNIGLISNGAGLTMFSMDEIVRLGGKPANFLDTGERILRNGIADSLEILAQNPQVERILINVFAGGPRCDVVATKIVEAVQQGRHGGKPIFVSLRGRLEEEGSQILRQNPLTDVIVLSDFASAVHAAVTGMEREGV